MGWETDRRHLLVKRPCFAQFGIRSAACRVWSFLNRVWRQQDVKTSESETVPTRVCGMPHTAVGTVDGRHIQPFLSGTTPSPPKFNVNVIWSALAPMDERNQTPNTTFGNTRVGTLRFRGAGFNIVNIVRVAGFEYCVHLLLFFTFRSKIVGYQRIWPRWRTGKHQEGT